MWNIAADLTFLVQKYPMISMILICAIFLCIVVKRIVKTVSQSKTNKILKNIENKINIIEKSQQENEKIRKSVLDILKQDNNEK